MQIIKKIKRRKNCNRFRLFLLQKKWCWLCISTTRYTIYITFILITTLKYSTWFTFLKKTSKLIHLSIHTFTKYSYWMMIEHLIFFRENYQFIFYQSLVIIYSIARFCYPVVFYQNCPIINGTRQIFINLTDNFTKNID
jgi:hypothetical protein